MDVDDSLARNRPRRSASVDAQPRHSDAVDHPTASVAVAYGIQDTGHFGAVVRRLLARGFVVVKQHQARGHGNDTDEEAPDAAAGGPPADGGGDGDGGDVVDDDDGGGGGNDENDDEVSSVCGQLECLSVMEGVAYGIRVADRRDAARARSVTALATAGAHPNIVSYFSNWTDPLYRYVQLEFCPDNLSSASDRLVRGADFRAVLEHVSCALYYLHRVKRYAHNRVNRWNVYRTNVDGDSAVYKLGGFLAATRLRQPEDDAPAFADVQSLCATVSRLMRRRGHGLDADEDARELRSYLESAATGRVNALNVWRWCCSTRQRQQQQRDERPHNVMAMVFGNSFFGGRTDLF